MEPGELLGWLPVVGLLVLIVVVERVIARWSRVAASCSAGWSRVHRRVRPEPPRPLGRPIELIAQDARRIGIRFHRPGQGLRHAKLEGLRRAYDDVLAEACDALGIDHLLRVLPPSKERDLERGRVEWMLAQSGLDLPDAA